MLNNHKQPVKVYRASIITINDETIIEHNVEPDATIDKLSIEQLSNNRIAIKRYGAEADSRIRISLERNQELNKYDLVEWKGRTYSVDSLPNHYRRFKTVDAIWV